MNAFCSMFSQLLKLFPRTEFQGLVRRHVRGFTCWGQFVAMLFCQLGRAYSPKRLWFDKPRLADQSTQGLVVHSAASNQRVLPITD